MKTKYKPYLKQYARRLRSHMTDAERLVWKVIRRKQLNDVQFYRQKPIGSYIVDFYCPSRKVIIEIDGRQHVNREMKQKDKRRDQYLTKTGFMVLRFNDLEVLKNIEGVVKRVVDEL